ncbi:hypothetical protein FNU79_06735 [Deinococcus detaillensis]|uniref:Uncharacterized protein n=1 Tax=Deinococcus detaillensis TaxID=2592048 RepID=A0A553V1N1_9DEIO|nr:hypothetical protein [Deinococcus detaillensis]TSA86355.1 hypothetical protein FNU79_06735 [Deinococcus detaillensis]
MNPRFDALFEQVVAEHGRFGHPAHLHLSWLLLEETGALGALAAFNAGLLTLAQSLKLTDKYNATLTTAFFFLVLERRVAGQTWTDFAAQHSDLLDWQQRERFLSPFYDLAELGSAAARQNFLMPHLPPKDLLLEEKP